MMMPPPDTCSCHGTRCHPCRTRELTRRSSLEDLTKSVPRPSRLTSTLFSPYCRSWGCWWGGGSVFTRELLCDVIVYDGTSQRQTCLS